MADQRKRYEEYGEAMKLSAKQWAIVARVAEKVHYDAPPEDESDIQDWN